jgi:hypothetical protein
MTRGRTYFKSQTAWIRRPARIRATRCDEVIGVGIIAEHSATVPPREEASIFLTPHEAQAFAAWLSQQAEHLLAKQARAAARKAARRAAKESQS